MTPPVPVHPSPPAPVPVPTVEVYRYCDRPALRYVVTWEGTPYGWTLPVASHGFGKPYAAGRIAALPGQLRRAGWPPEVIAAWIAAYRRVCTTSADMGVL